MKIIRERLGACKVREGVNAAENCAKDLQLFKDVTKAYRDRCKSTSVTFFTLNLCKTRSHILGQWFSKLFGVRILFTYIKVIEGVNDLWFMWVILLHLVRVTVPDFFMEKT